MAVHLTRIYTRTGDDGSTGLADFSRVSKDHPRLAAIGDVDETNAALGIVATLPTIPAVVAAMVRRIQNELFDLGADLATPQKIYSGGPDEPDASRTALRVRAEYVQRLEQDCDLLNAGLPALTSFVLPGGTPVAAALHVARAVARRAERSVWALAAAEPQSGLELPARYLNRLSDLLFIASRVSNPSGDVLWVPGGERPSD